MSGEMELNSAALHMIQEEVEDEHFLFGWRTAFREIPEEGERVRQALLEMREAVVDDTWSFKYFDPVCFE